MTNCRRKECKNCKNRFKRSNVEKWRICWRRRENRECSKAGERESEEMTDSEHSASVKV